MWSERSALSSSPESSALLVWPSSGSHQQPPRRNARRRRRPNDQQPAHTQQTGPKPPRAATRRPRQALRRRPPARMAARLWPPASPRRTQFTYQCASTNTGSRDGHWKKGARRSSTLSAAPRSSSASGRSWGPRWCTQWRSCARRARKSAPSRQARQWGQALRKQSACLRGCPVEWRSVTVAATQCTPTLVG